MKNPWKIVTGLAVLCAAASMGAQAGVIDDEHFTAAEGDAAGNLTGPNWGGNLARFGTVDPSGTGTELRNLVEMFQTATHTTSPGIADRHTVGMEFSFSRASGDISDANNTLC